MPEKPTLSHPQATLAALLVTVLWSSSWILIRWGLDDEALPPLVFAALRYGIATLVLAAVVAARPAMREQVRTLRPGAWLQVGILGIVFYAITQGAQFVAIDNQPAATSSLVLSWTPLLVVGLSAWSLGETPRGRQSLGAVLVAVGAWAYFAGDLGATVVGMLAALIGLAANAASALLGRHVNRRADVSPTVITALSMGVGSMLLLAVGAAAEGVPRVSGRAWAIILWLAVINTALAFTLWNLSLRRLSAVESAGINNTMLIQIALLAWVFLAESPGPLGLTGIVLASIGIFLTQTGGLRQPRTSSSLGARASRE